MFYFYADDEKDPSPDNRKLRLKRSRLFPDLASASGKKHHRILVVDMEALPLDEDPDPDHYPLSIPPLEEGNGKTVKIRTRRILNLHPYVEPLEVEAAGGLVKREKNGKLQVLSIFRKGVWDLPKGKLDPGESIEECAVREVCEEVGIDRVSIIRPLDVTVHGYRENGRYRIKTTHWFLMKTKARRFHPEKKEGIERVKWMSWKKAQKKIGYSTLRSLLERTRILATS